MAVIDDPTAKVVNLSARRGPSKPTLDSMGPGVESIPSKGGPRSTMGRGGMRGGFKPRRR
jgi:hypothetical protein